jgi:RNA polymerase sigma factor (sigma-70 family)
MDSLTPRERECFTLIRFEGLSEEKVAERLGLRRSSVCAYYSRGRAKLLRHKKLRRWL